MKAKRWRFEPKEGEEYDNHGGGRFRCLRVFGQDALFQSVKSGWTFMARECHTYEDGTIDWNWSTGGHFAPVER